MTPSQNDSLAIGDEAVEGVDVGLRGAHDDVVIGSTAGVDLAVAGRHAHRNLAQRVDAADNSGTFHSIPFSFILFL